jgi:hypothetical protein
LAALPLPYICPICSVVAPCHPGAALHDLRNEPQGRDTSGHERDGPGACGDPHGQREEIRTDEREQIRTAPPSESARTPSGDPHGSPRRNPHGQREEIRTDPPSESARTPSGDPHGSPVGIRTDNRKRACLVEPGGIAPPSENAYRRNLRACLLLKSRRRRGEAAKTVADQPRRGLVASGRGARLQPAY